MSALQTLVQMRSRIQKFAESIPAEQALVIPDGFNNNIAWNICHIFVTHQLLCYKLSGLPMAIDDTTVAQFSKGSSPADWEQTPDFAKLYPLLTELAESFAKDYESGRFQEFTPYRTSAGIELTDIESALSFNNMHEGLHLGYAMALKRAL